MQFKSQKNYIHNINNNKLSQNTWPASIKRGTQKNTLAKAKE